MFTIAYVGTYPPRACGIASFTNDLARSLRGRKRRVKALVVAVDDEKRDFGSEVKFLISKNDRASYVAAALQINAAKVDAVSLQHEYGIFGGESGEYILDFCLNLKKPLITTFHTVLQQPSQKERHIIYLISQLSRAVVTTIDSAKEILRERFQVDPDKIVVIKHGTIPARRGSAMPAKRQLKLSGRTVLTTFGLISRSKGLEYVIQALPPLARTHPNILYVIVGETHPEVLKHEGESYRAELAEQTRNMRLENHVRFVNRYLRPEEISTYLHATDIYLAPYTSQAQVSSGTITYALGHGKAVIATPTTFTKEILTGGRGLFCNFEDPYSLAASINQLLVDHSLKRRLERNALRYGREVAWKKVAGQYEDVFMVATKKLDIRRQLSQSIRLDHLAALVDDTAVLQHAKFSIPNRREGYTVDDSARAIVAITRTSSSKSALAMQRRLVGFILQMQSEDGKLSNLMDYSRKIMDAPTDGDHLGRAIWAMGVLLNSHQDRGVKSSARQVFDRALPWARTATSPRVIAYTCLGLGARLGAEHSDENLKSNLRLLADRLVTLHNRTHTIEWDWFEEKLTYDNARLCQALLTAYSILGDPVYLKVAEDALQFLIRTEISHEVYSPVGNLEWYVRGGRKSEYDQQPVETGSFIEAVADAYRLTAASPYRTALFQGLGWFFGQNTKSVSLVDSSTGACYDGLTPDGLNLNQGAESTIAFLLAASAAIGGLSFVKGSQVRLSSIMASKKSSRLTVATPHTVSAPP